MIRGQTRDHQGLNPFFSEVLFQVRPDEGTVYVLLHDRLSRQGTSFLLEITTVGVPVKKRTPVPREVTNMEH